MEGTLGYHETCGRPASNGGTIQNQQASRIRGTLFSERIIGVFVGHGHLVRYLCFGTVTT
jgi:hypothetical protein